MSEKIMRAECDGPVNIWRNESGNLVISAIHNREETWVLVSEFNACRILGMLSVMLGLPLTKTAAKQIAM